MKNIDNTDDAVAPDIEESLEDALAGDESKIEIDVDDPAINALGEGGIESLKSKLQEAEENALRHQAEVENFRRRARREMDDYRKFANQPLMTDLFPVIDNIDRALEAAEKAGDATGEASEGLLAGFKMVAQHLLTTLEKHHCKKINALGEPFDPTFHEAIQHMPSDEYENNMVMLVAQDGYQLHDRCVRPSQVIVSKGPDA